MICSNPVRARRRWVVAVAALLALAACSGDESDSSLPSATLGTEPPRTTTTDPYAIPPVIDEAYVNRVLAGLDAAQGEIVRILARTRTISPEVIDRLKAIYADRELLQLQIDIYQETLASGMQNYRTNPGDGVTRVTELISSQMSCIFAKVHRDYTRVAIDPDPRFSNQWIAIRPVADLALVRYNGTGWAFVYEGFQRDLSAPRTNPCLGA
jgi:hypothetical protein